MKVWSIGYHGINFTIPFLSAILIFVFLSGCASPAAFKLQENFEGESIGAAPPHAPPPTPPADDLTWHQQFVLPRVVGRDIGGQWVSVSIKPNYIARGFSGVLTAVTDTFSKSGANVRGHLTLRLVGSGHVLLALFECQTPTGAIAGVTVSNGVGVASLGTIANHRLASLYRTQEWYRMPSYATGFGGLGGYTAGETIDISWSIDQSNRNVNISAGVGNSTQQKFDIPTTDGMANTPFQKMWLLITAVDFNTSTILFLDDLTVEEL